MTCLLLFSGKPGSSFAWSLIFYRRKALLRIFSLIVSLWLRNAQLVTALALILTWPPTQKTKSDVSPVSPELSVSSSSSTGSANIAQGSSSGLTIAMVFLKPSQFSGFSWDIWGHSREVCRGMCFGLSHLVAYSLAFLSLPPSHVFRVKYTFVTLISVIC